MVKFSLADTVNLFNTQVSIAHHLWGVYAAASAAVLGFAVTSRATLTWPVGLAASLAYAAFATGNLYMVLGATRLVYDLRKVLLDVAESGGELLPPIASVIRGLARTANEPRSALVAHLFVDLSVIASVWIVVLGR